MSSLQNDLKFSYNQSASQYHASSSESVNHGTTAHDCSFEIYNYTQPSEFGPHTAPLSYSTASTPQTVVSPSVAQHPCSYTPNPIPQQYFPAPLSRSASRSRSLNPSHIPRPRNAFMIFRSEFAAGQKIGRTVEHDHRHISRIIGHIWNEMPEMEKDVWRRKAEREKLEHLQRYPGYRFCPGTRSKPPTRRNVKRNGAEEIERCRQVAQLLMSGKQGEELTDAVKNISSASSTPLMTNEHPYTMPARRKTRTVSPILQPFSSSSVEIPSPLTPISHEYEFKDSVFLSPLLPPPNKSDHSQRRSGTSNSSIDLYSERISQPVRTDTFSATPYICNIGMDAHDVFQFSFFSPSGTYVSEDTSHSTISGTEELLPLDLESSSSNLGSSTSALQAEDHSHYSSSIDLRLHSPYSQHDAPYPPSRWNT